MAAYGFGVKDYSLVFYNVKVGGNPRRVDLLETKSHKKFPIPFNASGFDLDALDKAPVDQKVKDAAKKVLIKPNVLKCANGYWTNQYFPMLDFAHAIED